MREKIKKKIEQNKSDAYLVVLNEKSEKQTEKRETREKTTNNVVVFGLFKIELKE